MITTLKNIVALPELPAGKISRPLTTSRVNEHADLKALVWIYFFLLLFEGAMRKWLLPGLATPLLVVRDPFALIIVILSWQRGLLPTTPYLFGMLVVGTIGFFTATLLGHGNLWVAIYGARILLLHYPMIFAIGRIFTKRDVISIGRVSLWLSIPITVLLIFQFYSPQSSWVNMGIGGNTEGSGFSGAMGFYRPSTTFSFTNGTSLFFGFVAAFIIYFWIGGQVNRILLLIATTCLLIAIPLSISRSLFFGVGVSILFGVFAITRKPGYFGRFVIALLGFLLLFALLARTDFFQNALMVFTVRFENANQTEGGLEGVLVDRYLGGLVGALTQAANFPFFGYGLGLGTNVGSMLMTGKVSYLISEGEWGRLIGEMGPLMGFAVILIRVALCIRITLAAYFRITTSDFLPWLLLSVAWIVIPQGQWAQPTTLGFAVMVGGLLLASLRNLIIDKGRIEKKKV